LHCLHLTDGGKAGNRHQPVQYALQRRIFGGKALLFRHALPQTTVFAGQLRLPAMQNCM
jgi:hypothetical protein